MGWFDGLVQKAQNFGGGLLRGAGNIQTPIRSGAPGSPQVRIQDLVHSFAPATVSAVAPTIKSSSDLVGTVGGWMPGPAGAAIRQRKAETSSGLNDIINQAHQSLGINDKNLAAQTANLIPKLVGTAASFETGGAEAAGVAKITQGLAQAGMTAKGMKLLGAVADTSPGTAKMLTNYMLHPETDINLFKAVLNPKAAGASLRLAKAAGSAAGGTMGYNVSAGAQEGKTPGQIAKSTALGLPTGAGIEFGNEAMRLASPKVIAFLQEAIPNAAPAVKAKLRDVANTFATDVHAYHDPTQEAKDAAMKSLHSVPLDDATRMQITKELTAVGEHGAAAKVAQASTHGHVVEALQGTQLHPEAPIAGRYTFPTPNLPAPGTPLSHMDPAMIAHDQAVTAEKQAHTVNMNSILEQKHDPSPNVLPGQPQRAGSMFEGKIAQLKARQAANTIREAGLAKAEMAAREQGAPSPAEMEQMNANAQAPAPRVPQKTTGPINLKGMIPEPKTKMAPNETGSAQENQVISHAGKLLPNEGKTLPRPIGPAPNAPDEPIGRSGKLGSGEAQFRLHTNDKGEQQVVDASTGEPVHTKAEGGDVYTRVHNQILSRAENYGKGNRQPIVTLQGRQQAGEDLGKQLQKQIETDLPNAADRELLTHHLEDPSVKVPDHIQRVADRVKPIRDLALHTRQAINPEVRGVENYMSHIVERPKDMGLLRGGTRRVSTFSKANQGRTLHMLEDTKTGETKLGSTEGMQKMREGHYQDPESGQIYKAHPATIKDFQKNNIPVESDAAKILGKYVGDTNRVKENATLIDHLKNSPEWKGKLVPPGQKLTAGQQIGRYRTTNIKGLEGYRMPNKLAFQLEGAMKTGKGSNILLKGYDAASGAVTKTIFYNMVTHPVNMLYNFGVGSGNLSKFGPLGTVRALKQLGPAMKAIGEKNEDFTRLQNAGMKFGGFGGGNKPGMLEKLGTKLAGDIGGKIGGAGDKANLIRQWYKANTKVIGYTDDHLKAALALAGEKQGMSTQEAVHSAEKFLVDYGNSGAFEKKVVSRFANFYPWVKGNAGALGGMARHPVQNAGALTNLALTGAAWYELNKGYQAYTGNAKANVRAPGMLGIAKDVVTGAKDITKGKVPSAITSHMNPLQKEALAQATGKDVGTGQPLQYKKGQTYTDANGKSFVWTGKSQDNRATHAAGNLVAPLSPVTAIAKEKKSPLEVALNQFGLNTPHKANEPAAPKIGPGRVLSGINTVKSGSSSAVANAAAYKAAGGNKLLYYQITRAAGDKSMDSFFKKAGNSKLDPTSPDFKGYANQSGSSVINGKDIMKKLGGSSLTYMQAQKLGGSSTYDKFFEQHPELNPTNPQFQGFKGAGSASSRQQSAAKAEAYAIRSQSSRGQSQIRNAKYAMSKFNRGGKAVRAKAAPKRAGLKIAAVKNLTPTRKVKIKTVA